MNSRIIAVVLLLYSVFGNGLLDGLDFPLIVPVTPEVSILDVEKPSESVLEKVKIFKDIITEEEDRQKIAIFNYEFSKRVVGYETSSQQINDVYSLAGKLFFSNSIVGKYEGLSEHIVNLMEEVLTDENHRVSEQEKSLLSTYFSGVAWVLIQKD
jgi:hypothetical protein